ncbi:hypothetical protein [Rhizobium phage RHph_X3_9]|nr:hypothetical protein [Rhizobium phage RHph_X3_9]
MITLREAKQRAEVYNGRIVRCQATGDLICTLNEWRGKDRETFAYYTNCIEDAVLTIGAMRRHAQRKAA